MESVCVDILDIANGLTADGALDQLLGAAVTGNMVPTWTEDGRNPRTHADLAQSLVLDIEQQLLQFLGLGVV